MNIRFFFLCISLFLVSSLQAQQLKTYVYWVTLKDKDSSYSISKPETFLSEKSIARRQKYGIAIDGTDLPVSRKYVDTLSTYTQAIVCESRWLNAVAVELPSKKQADSLKRIPFVTSITYLGEKRASSKRNRVSDINELITALASKVEGWKADSHFYGKAYSQVNMLNAIALHQSGFDGRGVTIAVLDAGFHNANRLSQLRTLFDSSRIAGTKDFVDPATGVFEDDDHGLAVLSTMAAYSPNEMIGTAPAASYWLLRSEDATNETLMEEALWTRAAEFADSVGADIISSSLGYNEFDDMTLNHRYKDLNGNTTIITKAANHAAAKGMMVVNSAGNEGDDDWRYIAAPADAGNIITVGSVDSRQNQALFSSIGPTYDKRIKPDVMAQGENTFVLSSKGVVYGGNGTSYSCPLISGVVACLLEAAPAQKNTEIAQALRLSSSQYYAPDKFMGYGVPDAMLALKMLGGDTAYPLNRDQLLDVRYLDDNNVHVSFYVHSPQKLTILIEDELGTMVYKDNMNIKEKGLQRIPVKKGKKLKKGNYALKLILKDTTGSMTFSKT